MSQEQASQALGQIAPAAASTPAGEGNPYLAPRSNVDSAPAEAAPPPKALVAAGKWRRLGTFVVDYFCFMVFGFVVGIGITLVFGPAGVRALQRIPEIVLGALLMFTYYMLFEGTWGRTPGKLLLGTRVVTEDGGAAPTLTLVAVRTVSRFIPFEPFSFLFANEGGWHDQISHTRVVRTRGV